MPVLLLNASYEPLRVISWQRAICLQLAERADLVEEVEDKSLRTSGGKEFPFPAVVRLREMVVIPFRRGVAPITRRPWPFEITGCAKRSAAIAEDPQWTTCFPAHGEALTSGTTSC